MKPRAVVTGFVFAAVLIHVVVFIAHDGLRGEPVRDETHFWQTTLTFVNAWPPGLDDLRDYNELNTPLPFVVFAAFQRATEQGLFLGRLLNLGLALGTILLIGLASPDRWRGVRCAAGLLIFPYFLGTGVYLYTDMLAAAFGVAGLGLHRRRLPWLAALCFAVAIACRQYMLAIPAALVAWELTRPKRRVAAIVAPALGAATIAVWVMLFQGLAPPTALANQNLAERGMLELRPQNGLYFLAVLGLFVVVPETVLLPGRRSRLAHIVRARSLVIGAVVVVLFIVFPPLGNRPPYPIETMGLLDKAARSVMSDTPRLILFAALALLAALRFARRDCAMWLVLANTGLLMKGHIAWDKYALPCIACLWLLAAQPEDSGAEGVE